MKILSILVFLFCCTGLFSQECVDSTLIDVSVMCPAVYDPVCGCNGVTYSNSCEATNYGGVTSWTAGECAISACTDISNIDFGMCDMWLGYAFTGNGCSGISGCGYIVDGVDYTSSFYESIEECEGVCGGPTSNCTDVSNIDFGMCDMWLGYAFTGNGCSGISGCGYIVDNVDYTPSFYETLEECESNCGGPQDCISEWQIEQGFAVDCSFLYMPVCGCDGVTYQNPCIAFYSGGVTTYSIGACSDTTCLVIPAAIDFGDCEMPLGWALMEGGCVELSGCSYVGNNGYNYSYLFFDSSYECGSQCIDDVVVGPCIDETLIDNTVLCPALYDPVCGCNNVTYSNSCVAMYSAGVTTWTAGECLPALISKTEKEDIRLYPNPANSDVTIVFGDSFTGYVSVTDISGKKVIQQKINALNKTNIGVSTLQTGSYILEFVNENGKLLHHRLIKE